MGKRFSVSASMVGGLEPKGMAVKEAAQIRRQVVNSWYYSSIICFNVFPRHKVLEVLEVADADEVDNLSAPTFCPSSF